MDLNNVYSNFIKVICATYIDDEDGSESAESESNE
jgi:hypothetical protein